MEYKLSYLPVAKQDITSIVTYIAEKLDAPKAAIELLDDIEKTVEKLRDFPYMYKVYQSVGPLEHEYRVISIKNYLIFYVVLEQAKIVEIHRVIYAKMDVSKIIG